MEITMCEIFHCDHRGDRYCCHDCGGKGRCKNPCQNTPEKCGKSFIQEEEKRGHKNRTKKSN